uniref:Uncharacterized protein n=1 Tax=Janibacter limosus TaxID=53458 RepID=A0AC61U272_9MICO|nr:hypothetical protein [Janibacter limosus]
MTPTQQAGQLLMAAMQPGSPTGPDAAISQQGLGSMLYLGGWQGASTVAAASSHLQEVSPDRQGHQGRHARLRRPGRVVRSSS